MGMAIYFGLVFAIFLAAEAMLYKEGLWNTLVTLMNVVISGMIAFGFFTPVNAMLLDVDSTYVRLWPFLSLWIVFIITFVILQRLFTANLSRSRVRFSSKFDSGGGTSLAGLIGVAMVSFSFATAHVAPLPVEMLAGTFSSNQADEQPRFAILDDFWLGAMKVACQKDNWGYSSVTQREAEDFAETGLDLREELEKQKDLRIDNRNSNAANENEDE